MVTHPKQAGQIGILNFNFYSSPPPQRYHVIKLFQQYGKIVREQFIWHKHGPKRGEPKGFCFVEFATKQVRTRPDRFLVARCAPVLALDAYLRRSSTLTSHSSAPTGSPDGQGKGQRQDVPRAPPGRALR